jgi:DNA-binding response OmpR family regulator
LNGQKRLLMRALVAKRGSVLTNREIAALLYGGRADGGPQDLDGLVAVVVSRIRRAIQATGAALEIRSIYGEGYALVDADG